MKARLAEKLREHLQLRRHLVKHCPGHYWSLTSHYIYNLFRLSVLKIICLVLRRKIVVISLLGRMGDIVACEPVARQARQQFPNAVILWCVAPRYHSLIKGNPSLNGILTVVCLTEWMWLQRHRYFDRIIDLQVNLKECGYCARPQKKQTGDLEITTENYYHYGPLLRTFTQSAGYPVPPQQPYVYVSTRTFRAVDRLKLPARFAAIHTLSDEESRDWDLNKWRALVALIDRELGLPVVEVGHRSKLEISQSERFVNLCGCCKTLETAEVIRRAEIFIGVDSGPAHLANAMETRGVILLGSYRAFPSYMPFTGFYADGRNVTIIRHDGPAREIAVATCFAAVQEGLARKAIREPVDARRRGPALRRLNEQSRTDHDRTKVRATRHRTEVDRLLPPAVSSDSRK
jgi:ADP-heptose:LPS heptosyltransferase